MVKIAIDAMGGDHGIKTTLPAIKTILAEEPSVEMIVVGNEALIAPELRQLGILSHPRIKIQHASEVVEMDELPSLALRNKKDSSMRVAINLVKLREADACVSAGNTGALMATSRFVLKMLPGISRPAIVFEIPSLDLVNKTVKKVYMLDLGANVDCDAQQLYEFAIMGSALAKSLGGIASPRLSLLNIGEEEMKGLDSIKQAAKLLLDHPTANYIGFIEGNQIFFDHADVVVCDGFVGNVALKTTEGVATMIGQLLKDAINASWLTKLLTIPAIPVLSRLKKRLDMSQFNGASLLGLRGIVIKSHGGVKAPAFATAIRKAIEEVKQAVPQLIHDEISAQMSHENSKD